MIGVDTHLINRTLEKSLFVERIRCYLEKEFLDKVPESQYVYAEQLYKDIIAEIEKRLEGKDLAVDPDDLTDAMIVLLDSRNHLDIKSSVSKYILRLYVDDVITLRDYLKGEK